MGVGGHYQRSTPALTQTPSSSFMLTVDRHGGHHQGHLGPAGFVVADGRQQQVVLRRHDPGASASRPDRGPDASSSILDLDVYAKLSKGLSYW